MISTIQKRDGRTVLFDREKIAQAIYKAARSLGGTNYSTSIELAEQVAGILAGIPGDEPPTVELIQDTVEKVLIENGHARTAKEFILYRAQRTRVREMNTRLMRVFEDLTFQDAMESDMKRENANIDGDTAMGTMLKYGSESAKQFYEMFILDPKYSRAHMDGDIHIHDLEFLTLTTTCCQIDIDKLFEGGFCTGHGYIREPKDIRTYASLACIAIQSDQNDQHGGQSIPNFDFAMAKGVAKTFVKLYESNLAKLLDFFGVDEAGEKAKEIITEIKAKTGLDPALSGHKDFNDAELSALIPLVGQEDAGKLRSSVRRYTVGEVENATYQAMEALIHNLNTMHSRAGAQVPFSSLNYGTDTSEEGRLVVKSILTATYAGLGKGETAVFPIHIFKVKEGVSCDEGDLNYDLFKLAMKVSAKRLYPNFSFIDAPFNISYYRKGRPETEAAYMGCRTRVIANRYDPENEIVHGRGNLSYTSVNLPRIAIKANGNVDFFFDELERVLELACEQLMSRYRIIAQKTVKNFPFLMGQGVWMGAEKLGPDDEIGEILKNGTLTVGFIGLAECLTALIGKHHGQSQEAQNLGLDIIGFMRSKMDQRAMETGFNYTLLATPGEGLSGRFVGIDRKKFGSIPGVTDREYYTNSFHIPVHYNISAYEKITLEAPYHGLTNGGHITYVELDGDPGSNLEAFESIVRYMKEAGVGYGSINHPVDRDPVCGFSGVIADECPSCGRAEADGPSFERIRRVTGYIGTLDRFNNAKQAEVGERVKHGAGGGYE